MAYAQKRPVWIDSSRCAARAGHSLPMSLIAVRIAFVTLIRARSAGDEKFRSRPPKTNGLRELARHDVDLLLDACGAFRVAPVARLLELGRELVEPLAVLLLRLLVEHCAAIGEPRGRELGIGVPGSRSGSSGRRGGHELEDVHLAAGRCEQRGDVAKSLDVAEANRLPRVADSPELSFATEDRFLIRRLGSRPVHGRRLRGRADRSSRARRRAPRPRRASTPSGRGRQARLAPRGRHACSRRTRVRIAVRRGARSGRGPSQSGGRSPASVRGARPACRAAGPRARTAAVCTTRRCRRRGRAGARRAGAPARCRRRERPPLRARTGGGSTARHGGGP